MNEEIHSTEALPFSRVSLIGLPGAGKSTIGRRLARQWKADFADSDVLLESQFGMPIADFFAAEGESRFRVAETEVLDELTQRSNVVIATGGGIVLREENRRLLKERTLCIWLEAEHEALLQRLRRSNRRPLFRGADPKIRLLEMAAQREPLYRETAHVVVAAADSAGATCRAIVRALETEAARSGSPAP